MTPSINSSTNVITISIVRQPDELAPTGSVDYLGRPFTAVTCGAMEILADMDRKDLDDIILNNGITWGQISVKGIERLHATSHEGTPMHAMTSTFLTLWASRG